MRSKHKLPRGSETISDLVDLKAQSYHDVNFLIKEVLAGVFRAIWLIPVNVDGGVAEGEVTLPISQPPELGAELVALLMADVLASRKPNPCLRLACLRRAPAITYRRPQPAAGNGTSATTKP